MSWSRCLMGEADYATLFSFVPDAGATVIFIVFMFLWHKRTMARDKQFAETLTVIMSALMECVKQSVTK